MAKIEEIDQNFKETQVETHDDVIFCSCLQEPFQIYGLLLPESAGSSFLRIPARVAEGINQDVAALNHNTAGGGCVSERIRRILPFEPSWILSIARRISR